MSTPLGVVSFAAGPLDTTGVFGGASGSVFALSLMGSLGFSVVMFLTFLYASTAFSKMARPDVAAGSAIGEPAKPPSPLLDE